MFELVSLGRSSFMLIMTLEQTTWTGRGSVFYNGDIVLDSSNEKYIFGDNEVSYRKKRSAVRTQNKLWPFGILKYKWASNIDKKSKRVIRKAMQHIADKTCIRFQKAKNKDENYVRFISEPGVLPQQTQHIDSFLERKPLTANYTKLLIIPTGKLLTVYLPQTKTQHIDSFTGEKTITANYTNWYLEVLLRRVTVNAGQNPVIFSPNHKAFVSIQTDGNQFFAAEEYADLTELRALAELIGPYGMKYMGERLMNHVASQVDELKKLVVGNKEVLQKLRTNYDKPEVMRDLYRQLTSK
ncbi:NCK-associated protein 1 [Mytilus galloprovincialis]|uniref:NCK-associated protein 1 n=1 Tax=Mytilus galloprovincialis TaxID=29158 RepID=A0A8B6G519_MYTGA|nr:NCK-associated protein 1 [Mytilus galloprovincialis]